MASSHPVLRYPWAFLIIFFFNSNLPFTETVLWATVKAGEPIGAEPPPCEIPVRSRLLAPASPLVQDTTSIVLSTFRLMWLQPFLGCSSNLTHRCLPKIPLPQDSVQMTAQFTNPVLVWPCYTFQLHFPSLLNHASVHHPIWTSLQVLNVSLIPFSFNKCSLSA